MLVGIKRLLLEKAGEDQRRWSEWNREGAGSLPLLFPICAFFKLFPHLESSIWEEMTQWTWVTGSLWEEGQPPVYLSQETNSACTERLLLSRVPMGSSGWRAQDPQRERLLVFHTLPLLFTHTYPSLSRVLKRRRWPRFEINIDQQLHIPVVISLISNTGDNPPTG